ncbi:MULTISPECIES: hypothetical protein [Rhodanobacter]|uniref:Uncharacterized protein n=1 Tax=Rhodanobacter denitrificans TaxID=666685 RepID=M4NPL3_9GAMM|nr:MULTISPECIES: hypothetical protein [Rhodanobacter]AGG89586.1 hypothetical protein R2APBS1_2497 [Rhodanobacter denitrificans]UJJ49785.1 hypothetical protein LRK52_11125 [Rhodanobacter denitrificans]UJM88465.1 hypothetical protein LRJ86_09325 [Rhodanobacter denitrificans]UJM92498.1 hypothetical protein LRK32_11035 [Rhodanobacter denitrificans]UJM96028.1 hypothetical protein LRK44_11040 [Rhodanobacter denitrificans]
MQTGFRVHNGTEIEQIEPARIVELARLYELDLLAPGRYSSLFIVNLYLLDKVSGVDPHQVISEIKHLEGLGPSLQTKEATEFKGSVLKGLWHKHFLPILPSTFAHNIINHFGKNGLEKLVNNVFDSAQSDVVTSEMVRELSRRVVEESIVDRGSAGKLTGEWIIFAKENGQNYYLSISPHASGDENIAANLKGGCSHEFPFIAKYVP